MRFSIVEKPLRNRPHECIVTGRADGEVVDFHSQYQGVDPWIYIKRSILEEAASKACGMLSEQEAGGLREQIAELQNCIESADLRGVSTEALIAEVNQRRVHLALSIAAEEQEEVQDHATSSD